jgi:hypothetical protein
MKQQEVFRKTGEILKELSDQYEDLKSTADNLNDLELELFIANAHFLIDHAEILRKLNLQKLQVQHTLPPHVEEPEAKAPVIEEPKAPVIEEPKAPIITPEAKKPAAGEPKYFEPLVQQVKPVIERTPFKLSEKPAQPEPVQLEITPAEEEQPTPQIDLHTGSDKDSYSFEREEPEVIKHELIIDEADDWDEEEQVIPLVTEAILPLWVSPGSRKCTWSSIQPGKRCRPSALISLSALASILPAIFSIKPFLMSRSAWVCFPSFTMVADLMRILAMWQI